MIVPIMQKKIMILRGKVGKKVKTELAGSQLAGYTLERSRALMWSSWAVNVVLTSGVSI